MFDCKPSEEMSRLGATPPASPPDFKGFLIEGMTTV
jgi:hypothetical protein